MEPKFNDPTPRCRFVPTRELLHAVLFVTWCFLITFGSVKDVLQLAQEDLEVFCVS
jgi:hypothetical protein